MKQIFGAREATSTVDSRESTAGVQGAFRIPRLWVGEPGRLAFAFRYGGFAGASCGGESPKGEGRPHRPLTVFFAPLFSLVLLSTANAAPPRYDEIRSAIQSFKEDARGPYKGIRWFCPNGTILPPKERCAAGGGLQHALPKDFVVRIAEDHGIYLGQILAGTAFDELLDAGRRGSRLKQYQIERFLQASDDGWILRRARYYRGSVQAEDEEAWGQAFLRWLLAKDDFLAGQFLLARRLVKDIPHPNAAGGTTRVRALARSLADGFPAFMDLRIKIHGHPDRSDVDRVREFGRLYGEKMPPDLVEQLGELERRLADLYRTASGAELAERYLPRFAAATRVGLQLKKLTGLAGRDRGLVEECSAISHLLWVIRESLPGAPDSETRVAMLSLSVEAESLLLQRVGEWRPETLRDLLEKSYVLSEAAAGAGFIEVWEWELLKPLLALPESPATKDRLSLEEFVARVDSSQRAVEWSTGMVRAVYGGAIDSFSRFEPLALGFPDDLIRSSVLLALGEVADRSSAEATRLRGLSHRVLDVEATGRVRGLNPGVARGKLEVVPGSPEGIELAPDRIYILLRAPTDLRPVAGIATVAEGNAVSHVQLLARNLGIPNAVISHRMLEELAAYAGREVFYAVSPHGTVLMKPADEMTEIERAILSGADDIPQEITVPTERLDLGFEDLLSLREVRATDSGRICGPKAANLGELSVLFPERVPPGLVIPFGVFRRHLDQTMPGARSTYWDALEELMTAPQDEAALLARLSEFHEAIRTIELSPELVRTLESRFPEIFGADMGEVSVFVRSDTNMEDLSDFTGAGLNRTVANVRGEKRILQAIRDVWASPFAERSFRWRRRFLRNPQAVYPSIVVLPSVDVDKSGVLVTAGLSSSDPRDLTVAFNWGGAGAVEGQAAETYLLEHGGADVLLSPAREPAYHDFLPEGGVRSAFVGFERPILSPSERLRLRELAAELEDLLPRRPGLDWHGPFDVELGFWNDRMWLFQVRPFAENRRARSSAYLADLDAALPKGTTLHLGERLGLP